MIKLEAQRKGDGIDVSYTLEGGTTDVLYELGCAVADAISAMADDLHADDALRESMATIVCADIARRVGGAAAGERRAEDKREDA